MKKICLVLLMIAITLGGQAMIETLSLEQLASGSDLIVSVKMLGVKETGKTPEGVEICANLAEIAAVHKGELTAGEKIKIKTFPGFEDGVSFTQDHLYLLFLQKQENYYIVTNSVQGSWEVDDNGKFMGMGTGKTLEDVKKAIEAKPLKFQPKVPDLQL